MKKVIVGVAALAALGAVAWASSPAPLGGANVSRGNLERIPDYNTVQSTAWYVDPAGADTGNTCLSPASPCLTHQRVLTLISAKHLRHQQVIYSAAGNYPCVVISGYQTDNSFTTITSGALAGGPISAGSGAGIAIVGTMVNSTLTTGSATGTITSSVTGSTALGVTFTTFTDSGATWTAGNLKGRFVTFGNFTRQVIYDNTATTVTMLLTTAAPANGTTYAIQDAASFFNTSCAVGSSVGVNIDGGFNGSITNQGAFIISDTTPGAGLTQYRLEQFGFANTTGLDVNNISMATLQLQDVQLQNTSDTVFQRIAAGAVASRFNCTRCASRRSAGNLVDHIVMNNQQAGFAVITGSLFEGGRNVVLGGEGQLLVSSSAINPIEAFGINARGPNTSISSFLCDGTNTTVTACLRWGNSADTFTMAKGQLQVASVTCRMNSGGGLCLDIAGAGVATVATSVFTTDAGEVFDPSTPLIRLNQGAGLDIDTASVVEAPTPNNVLLLQGNSGNTLTFPLGGIQASVPPCATDAISNWFCSP